MPRTTLNRYCNYKLDESQQEQVELVMSEMEEMKLRDQVVEKFKRKDNFSPDDVLLMAQKITGRNGLINRRSTNGMNRTWLYYFIGKFLEDFATATGPGELLPGRGLNGSTEFINID